METTRAESTDASTAHESHATVAGLTAFQRDVLWTLFHTGGLKGLAIKAQLEEYYGKEINHGRLYPNLDTLAEKGLVGKRPRDKRTNDYSLTEAGIEALEARQAWQTEVTA